MSESLRKLKDRASRLYSQGRLKEALVAYGEVVAQDTTELQCQLKIGDIHRRLANRDDAVAAYVPVARSYAADGLLLKAMAVCKMILALDSEHAGTQALLAELHGKRRGPEQAGPPVTLRGMGISPPPGGMVVAPNGGSFGMLELDDDGRPTSGLELDRGAPAIGSVGPAASAGPAAVWTAPADDAWTGDITLDDPVDDDIEVLAPVDTASAPPAVDPGVAARIVVGTPVAGGGAPAEGLPDEPLDIERGNGRERPETRAAVAWPTAGSAAERLPTAAPPAWPTAPVVAEDPGDDEEDLAAVQIPLFSELPRNAFIDLLVKMDMREVEPGEVLIREGDVGDAFYVVAAGRVRVSRRGTDGREIVLAFLTDSAFFGEMAVLQHGARTASVVAEDSSQIFEIRREVLDEVIESYPSVAKILRNFYRQRLLSTAMATHPVFTPFNPAERRGLMEMFKSRQVKAGEVVLEQGKKGTGLFILLHGQLEVVRLAPDGQAVTLAHLLASDMFGEMSLLTNEPTVARVLAVTDSFVLRLSRRKFDEVIMTHPQVLELVSEISSARTSINDALLGAQQSLTGGTVLV